MWVQLLKVPYSILFPLIILFCLIGSYSIANSTTDVAIMLIFGVIGYLMKKLSLKAAPMVLPFVLGPMLETALRQALIKPRGSFSIFFTHPISATCLLMAIALMVIPVLPGFRRRRPGATLEPEVGI
jgi:putative tricarboxylic transport membrane protein